MISAELARRIANHVSYPNFDIFNNQHSNNVVLLILERSCDVLTPLIHDTSYQSIAINELHIDNFYNYNSDKKVKKANINNHDIVWSTFKNNFIIDAHNNIIKNINALNSIDIFDYGQRIQCSVDYINSIIYELPKCIYMQDKYDLHYQLSEKCTNYFYDIKKIIYLEQKMLNFSYEINFENSKKFLYKIMKILSDDKYKLSDKTRLLMAYIFIFTDVTKKIIEKLSKIFHFTKQTLDLLFAFIDYVEKIDNHVPSSFPNKGIFKNSKNIKKDSVISDYQPLISDICESLLESNLSTDVFPVIPKKLYMNKKKIDKNNKNDCYIIFIMGGVTLCEEKNIKLLIEKHNKKNIPGFRYDINSRYIYKKYKSQ